MNEGDVHMSTKPQDTQAHYRFKRICNERENLKWVWAKLFSKSALVARLSPGGEFPLNVTSYHYQTTVTFSATTRLVSASVLFRPLWKKDIERNKLALVSTHLPAT